MIALFVFIVVDGPLPEILREVDVEIHSHQDCEYFYSQPGFANHSVFGFVGAPRYKKDSMLCAGSLSGTRRGCTVSIVNKMGLVN